MSDESTTARLIEEWTTGLGRESGAAKLLPANWNEKCPGCGKELEEWRCADCVKKYGPHLYKAMCDPFDYAIGLKNGIVIRTVGECVEICGEWVKINGLDEGTTLPFACPRGIQILLSEIAWVADAPHGS
jgi:hypothetical protein